MEPIEIRYKERRTDLSIGQSYSVTYLAPEGRVLSRVEVQIPLERGYSLAEGIGAEEVAKIEAAARDLARRVAEGMLAMPKGGEAA